MRQAAAKNTFPKMIMQIHANSEIAEIYRSLRFNLECSAFDQNIRMITITSSNRGEGKTTTAVNLAAAVAQSGKKTVLIDANLRSPAVHLAFGMDNAGGLSEYLESRLAINDIIKDPFVINLSLITSGTVPATPSELLLSDRLHSLFAQLKQNYDVILIDTPPILNLTDAKLIAAASEGVLLVVEHGKLRQAAANKIKEDFALMKANLLGIVVNKINRRDVREYLP
ncbi:CpsD/CapB family tyrosine-protein kinase [Ferviditalea candida]|uniref:non-specific protein-tyrosine kinase n=1 Tax=Ferviditalea candida TaxID=3108399 RepID=A0ABU5ZE32_9BACL|nr:CpsD/CapB family tyrosine-protein kinase [Paenibacillaceae bacterium T2]